MSQIQSLSRIVGAKLKTQLDGAMNESVAVSADAVPPRARELLAGLGDVLDRYGKECREATDDAALQPIQQKYRDHVIQLSAQVGWQLVEEALGGVKSLLNRSVDQFLGSLWSGIVQQIIQLYDAETKASKAEAPAKTVKTPKGKKETTHAA